MYSGFNADEEKKENNQFDYDLFKPKIAVVGVGGGGNNTVHRINSMDMKGV